MEGGRVANAESKNSSCNESRSNRGAEKRIGSTKSGNVRQSRRMEDGGRSVDGTRGTIRDIREQAQRDLAIDKLRIRNEFFDLHGRRGRRCRGRYRSIGQLGAVRTVTGLRGLIVVIRHRFEAPRFGRRVQDVDVIPAPGRGSPRRENVRVNGC